MSSYHAAVRQPVAVAVLTLTLAACSGPAPPPRSPQPAAPRDARVASFDGVPIAYTVAGQGAGAVLLIHGWSCDRGYWEAQLDDLARDYRVVAVDLAGHGDSGAGRKAWTLDSLGRDVAAVVDDLRLDSVILVGHSMGGPVALEAARHLPGRVVGVIGVDTLHDVEYRYPQEEWDKFLDGFDRDFAGSCASFARSLFPAGAAAELVDEIRADLCSAPPEVAVALLEAMRNYDEAAALDAAQVPLRCINASATFPTNVEANRRHSPEFAASIMDGVGHFPMIERPEEFNRLLRQAIEDLTSPHGV